MLDTMPKGKLYGNKNNFRTQKVLIAAKLGNYDLQLIEEHPPADKFPLGIMPAFEGDVDLFGADSIAVHICSCNGAFSSNCSEIVQWLQWAEGGLLPTVLGYVLPSISAANIDKKVSAALNTEAMVQIVHFKFQVFHWNFPSLKVVDAYKAELLAQLSHLNEILLSKTYLVGERFSLADISVAMDLLPAFQHVLDETTRKKFENVTRWFQTVMYHPVVKEVVNEVHFCEKVPHFNKEEFNQLSSKRNKQLSKKEGNKKDHPKQTSKAKETEVDDVDEIVAAEKTKDPFADMPKGSFAMDAFKRVYSNEDTATKAIPYLWENFDADANSIWFCEYKYPTELTLTFMSCNLISGMYQRLEKLKKNAFASMILFGTDNNSSISGVWIWRGQDLAFTLSPDWQVDYESYTWTKLDPKDEKTKKIVNEYLTWEGDFDGKKFNQGKIFK
ncbi:elongation factor 1 gamma, hypothetical protein [Dictyocaulus viviparus]|uniref:Elongation factor 1-gamma n=1 Tax=Dictyocaulus viviparus TaxID=29172 RepID=A0A0D8Y465_DICVI|nr:elongation factor 1 gamma, hypothetical protein [Dictyocaulus viviparus]